MSLYETLTKLVIATISYVTTTLKAQRKCPTLKLSGPILLASLSKFSAIYNGIQQNTVQEG
jgi:hypothetical protein